jgi:hypothetical protein
MRKIVSLNPAHVFYRKIEIFRPLYRECINEIDIKIHIFKHKKSLKNLLILFNTPPPSSPILSFNFFYYYYYRLIYR